MSVKKIRLAILISGRGSNMMALATAVRSFPAEVVLILADQADAPGLVWAKQQGLKTALIERKKFSSKQAFEAKMLHALQSAKADLIVLAGFMSVLSAGFIETIDRKILNIHPSLLPKFKGLHTHERALQAGESEHGCTVHFVTAELDSGPIVLQSRLQIAPDDTIASLGEKVLHLEHPTLVAAVGQIVQEMLEEKHKQAPKSWQRMLRDFLANLRPSMSAYRWRKLAVIPLALIFGLLLMASLAYVSLPWLINSEKFAEAFQDQISVSTDWELTYEGSEVRIRGGPELILHSPRLRRNTENLLEVEAKELEVRLWPLVFGLPLRLEIYQAEVSIEAKQPIQDKKMAFAQWLFELTNSAEEPTIGAIYFEDTLIKYAEKQSSLYEYFYQASGSVKLAAYRTNLAFSMLWQGEKIDGELDINSLADALVSGGISSNIDARLSSEFSSLQFQGDLTLSPFLLGKGEVDFELSDVDPLVRWIKGRQPFSEKIQNIALHGDLSFHEKNLSLTSAEIEIGEQRARGSISLVNGRELEGTLHFDRLEPSKIMVPIGIFSQSRIDPIDQLFLAKTWRNLNADLRLSVDEIVSQSWISGPAALSMNASGGEVNLVIGRIGVLDGDFSGQLSLHPHGEGIETKLIFQLGKADFEAASLESSHFQNLSGKFDLTGELASHGKGLTTWIEALEGKVKGHSASLRLNDLDLQLWLEQSKLNEIILRSPPSGQTSFDSGMLEVTILHGLADIGALALHNQSLLLTAAGQADLRARQLELSLNLAEKRAESEEEVQKHIAFKLSGPLNAPALSLIAQ